MKITSFSDMHIICDPVMLVGSGLCINTYSEEEARTRQLLADMTMHAYEMTIHLGVVKHVTSCLQVNHPSMLCLL